MTWLRIDDNFIEHPKVESLSDAAFRLHVRAMCYCARFRTDGVVPGEKVIKWGKKRAIDECLTVGVWHAETGSYVIHDFLVYNPSKADLDKKVVAGAKGGARASANRNAVAPATQSAVAPARVPVPSRPVPRVQPPVVVAISSRDRDPELGRAMRAIEGTLGINPIVVQKVVEYLEAGTPAEWIEAACEESALANARNWRYVAAILERWKRDGFRVDTRKVQSNVRAGVHEDRSPLAGVNDFDFESRQPFEPPSYTDDAVAAGEA